jgi:hypothetical protein
MTARVDLIFIGIILREEISVRTLQGYLKAAAVPMEKCYISAI